MRGWIGGPRGNGRARRGARHSAALTESFTHCSRASPSRWTRHTGPAVAQIENRDIAAKRRKNRWNLPSG
jgi:hypothetical protein